MKYMFFMKILEMSFYRCLLDPSSRALKINKKHSTNSVYLCESGIRGLPVLKGSTKCRKGCDSSNISLLIIINKLNIYSAQ